METLLEINVSELNLSLHPQIRKVPIHLKSWLVWLLTDLVEIMPLAFIFEPS